MDKDKDIWFIVRFKLNELHRFEINLKNQNFISYIPKFKKILSNNKVKITSLFPGYCFIKNKDIQINALKYTRGLIDIVRFGNNYASISDNEINDIKEFEKISMQAPIKIKLSIGDEVKIKSGPFKDHISKIVALPAKDRVTILMTLLGSIKDITIPLSSITKR